MINSAWARDLGSPGRRLACGTFPSTTNRGPSWLEQGALTGRGPGVQPLLLGQLAARGLVGQVQRSAVLARAGAAGGPGGPVTPRAAGTVRTPAPGGMAQSGAGESSSTAHAASPRTRSLRFQSSRTSALRWPAARMAGPRAAPHQGRPGRVVLSPLADMDAGRPGTVRRPATASTADE